MLSRLELLSVQYKLKQLNEKISLIHKNIDLLMQSLKNASTKMIKDQALVRWIDPALCAISMNKKEHQVITAKQDSIVVNEYSSSQQFTIKYDTVKPFNRFSNVYSGQLLAEGGAAEPRVVAAAVQSLLQLLNSPKKTIGTRQQTPFAF